MTAGSGWRQETTPSVSVVGRTLQHTHACTCLDSAIHAKQMFDMDESPVLFCLMTVGFLLAVILPQHPCKGYERLLAKTPRVTKFEQKIRWCPGGVCDGRFGCFLGDYLVITCRISVSFIASRTNFPRLHNAPIPDFTFQTLPRTFTTNLHHHHEQHQGREQLLGDCM